MFGVFRVVPTFLECVAEVHDTRDKQNSFEIIKNWMENYSHHHDNGNILNRIDLFNTNL
jgi:hypothetical protein